MMNEFIELHTSRDCKPIIINKNRVKLVKDDCVYMDDGESFTVVESYLHIRNSLFNI